jgi:hypothetical protein
MKGEGIVYEIESDSRRAPWITIEARTNDEIAFGGPYCGCGALYVYFKSQ